MAVHQTALLNIKDSLRIIWNDFGTEAIRDSFSDQPGLPEPLPETPTAYFAGFLSDPCFYFFLFVNFRIAVSGQTQLEQRTGNAAARNGAASDPAAAGGVASAAQREAAGDDLPDADGRWIPQRRASRRWRLQHRYRMESIGNELELSDADRSQSGEKGTPLFLYWLIHLLGGNYLLIKDQRINIIFWNHCSLLNNDSNSV